MVAVSSLPSGSEFVLVDDRLTSIARGGDAAGKSVSLRFVAADLDHGDEQAVALTSQPTMAALRPLSPVHLRARREVDGVHFSWVRRTRTGGDSWEIAEVPLGEDTERSEIDVLNAGTIARTISTATTAALYAQADELSDFGFAQSSIAVRIYQLSTVAGRGTPAVMTLSIAS
jgi:hypothetical protein